MSQPPSISYASANSPENVDDGHLKAIIICHYVWGGLILLLSCIAILYIVMGTMMLSGKIAVNQAGNAPFPVGDLFICIGSVSLLLGWLIGILNILSGRAIARRRWRTFSYVVAGINCASVPLGTLMGIFTFVVLSRDSVRANYAK